MYMEEIVKRQRKFYNTDKTKSVPFRKKQLMKLAAAIENNETEIYRALKQDLNKSAYEAYLTEIGIVLTEIKTAVRKLGKWAGPKRKSTPITHFPAKSYTVREPYGVVLILAPWNYPLQLSLAPLAGAIAAGNCVILKTSRSSPATGALLHKLLGELFPPEYVCCVEDTAAYEAILSQRYDYIFFTGSERVGKIVMKAASEHLTPVSLELGGKSPCIVDKSADVDLAAKRILWGKLLNAGQTCVAPDYVLIHQDLKKPFLAGLDKYMRKMAARPLTDDNYPKIITQKHFERLKGLIDREEHKTGGGYDAASRKIAPAVFTDAGFDSEIMKEEIFGPVLPVIAYRDLDSAIQRIREHPKPLACYIFARDRKAVERIINEVSFGGGCINDTVMHLANHNLPFGGVGSSGMGQYHGSYSFFTFSHEKGILESSSKIDIPFRYPPYRAGMLPLIKKIMNR